MNNLELYEYSIVNNEFSGQAYSEKEKIVITKDNSSRNLLMQANNDIIDYITTFEKIDQLDITEEEKKSTKDKIIDQICNLLKTDGINNSEFTSYWLVQDMSYSSFSALPYPKKIGFLNVIIPQYITNRHSMYQSHGYTATTLQVKSDTNAHKRSGQLGMRKVTDILQSLGINKFCETDLTLLGEEDNYYILPDNDGANAFSFLKASLGFVFSWSNAKQDKETDFLIKKGGNYYIVEHKHMKEGGGGQDKQMEEVIDFIKQSDNNISYVSFLDGEYFDKLGTNKIDGKIATQNKQIRDYLSKNNQNYFINTAGFIKLFS